VPAKFTMADHRQYLFHLVMRASDAFCYIIRGTGLVKSLGLDRTKWVCHTNVWI